MCAEPMVIMMPRPYGLRTSTVPDGSRSMGRWRSAAGVGPSLGRGIVNSDFSKLHVSGGRSGLHPIRQSIVASMKPRAVDMLTTLLIACLELRT